MRCIRRIFFTEVCQYSLLGLGLDFVKGLSLHSVGLSSRERLGQSKLVKLVKVSYYVKLLDLHRSNPFAPNSLPALDSTNLPESW
jgi:translation initiation factor 2-alpha kinase 4